MAALLLVVLAALAVHFRYLLLIRIPTWVLSRLLYHIRVHGLENVPAAGPALLVANHLTYMDALIIASQLRRPVRFLTYAGFLSHFPLKYLLRLARVIAIDHKSGPRALMQSLRTASEALAKGELVCVFPEGGISRTGFLLPFQRGMEHIVKRQPAPIIPVFLDNTWGTSTGYRGGRFFWKMPRRPRYPIWVSFGAPLPATTTAGEAHQAVQLLSAESAVRRAPLRLPVHRQFVRTAARYPFRPCLIDATNVQSPIIRYGAALVGAKLMARYLKPLVKDELMVGVWLPPSPGAALASIALAFLGKVAVNLNYTLSRDNVQSAIRQCGISHVLAARKFTERLPLDPGPGVEVIYLDDFRASVTRWQKLRAFLSILLVPGFIQERWLLGLGRHAGADLATIIFSSGSTGEPKGVMLTHANIAANAESMIQAIDPGRHDRLMGILPLFHSFGYTVTLWVPLQVGAATVFLPNPLAAREVGESTRKFQVTVFLSTPTFLRSYQKRCEADDFRSVRLMICGAEKLPRRVAEAFHERFGVTPLEGYGCTELSPVVSTNVPDYVSPDGSYRQIGHKPGTIGLPIPGVAVRVADRETLQPLPLGKEGLLLAYGANVMKGYLGRDDLTQKKLINGWYITGDLARIDEDGFITITGRQERFAKVAGEMVPLEKVEEEIHLVLATSERTCVVTAIPDERKGERLIVLHLAFNGIDVEFVRHTLSTRGLPNLCIPSTRDFIVVDELPILGSGKLDLMRCLQTAQDLARRE